MVVALAVSYPMPLYKTQHGRKDLRPSRSAIANQEKISGKSRDHLRRSPSWMSLYQEEDPILHTPRNIETPSVSISVQQDNEKSGNIQRREGGKTERSPLLRDDGD